MIQKPKKEVFDHFLEFGLLDRLDIADWGSTKCFPTFGNVTKSYKSEDFVAEMVDVLAYTIMSISSDSCSSFRVFWGVSLPIFSFWLSWIVFLPVYYNP